MAKDDAVQTIRDFIDNTKQTHRSPNLYTALTISHKGSIRARITAYDVLEIARQFIYDEVNALKASYLLGKYPLTGEGTKKEPYILKTPRDWLLAATNISDQAQDTSIYFNIGGQLIDIATTNRYASANALQEMEFVDFITTAAQQFMVSTLTNEKNVQALASTTTQQPQTIEEIVANAFPMLMQLISTFDTKHVSGHAQLANPAYSRLQDENADAERNLEQGLDKLAAITPESIEAMLADMRQQASDASMFEKFDIDAFITDTIQTITTQMGVDPNSASEEAKADLQLLIQSIKHAFLETENYNLFTALDLVRTQLSEAAKPGNVQGMSQPTEEFLSESTESTVKKVASTLTKSRLSPQHRHDLRDLNKRGRLNEIRATLAGQAFLPDRFIPVMVAALFLSETNRYWPNFLATMMMLDLIDSKESCPDAANDAHNLNTMLYNPEGRTDFVDGYGRLFTGDEKEKKLSLFQDYAQALFNEYSGEELENKIDQLKSNKRRQQKILGELKAAIAGKAKQNISGYHPMVHGNSYNETKNIDPSNPIETDRQLTIAEQKTANILLQWLHLMSPEGEIEFRLERVFLDDLSLHAHNEDLSTSNHTDLDETFSLANTTNPKDKNTDADDAKSNSSSGNYDCSNSEIRDHLLQMFRTLLRYRLEDFLQLSKQRYPQTREETKHMTSPATPRTKQTAKEHNTGKSESDATVTRKFGIQLPNASAEPGSDEILPVKIQTSCSEGLARLGMPSFDVGEIELTEVSTPGMFEDHEVPQRQPDITIGQRHRKPKAKRALDFADDSSNSSTLPKPAPLFRDQSWYSGFGAATEGLNLFTGTDTPEERRKLHEFSGFWSSTGTITTREQGGKQERPEPMDTGSTKKSITAVLHTKKAPQRSDERRRTEPMEVDTDKKADPITTRRIEILDMLHQVSHGDVIQESNNGLILLKSADGQTSYAQLKIEENSVCFFRRGETEQDSWHILCEISDYEHLISSNRPPSPR